MSWSVSSIGKPKAVASKIATLLAQQKCSEPEESIKNKIGELVALSLEAFPEAHPVRVTASGSQSTGADGKAVNQLQIIIEPLWGFVE